MANFLSYFWKIRLVRFGGGAFINLTLKLILAFIFKSIGLALWLNYALVQIIILFVSYPYHSIVTFRKKINIDGFIKFILSVLAFKILDYLMVVIINNVETFKLYLYHIPLWGNFIADYFLYITIFLSTVIIFFLRYFVYKEGVFPEKKRKNYYEKME